MSKKYVGENVTIFHGDCLQVLPDLQAESVDLVFADPPYNIGKRFGESRDSWPTDTSYAEWCYDWLAACIRVLSRQGTMYVMASTQSMPYLDLWLRDRLHIVSRIIWPYDSAGVHAMNRFGSLYEPILHCVKNPKRYTFNAEDIAVEARTGSVRKLIDYRKSEPAPYNSKKTPGNTWYIPRVRYRMSEYESHPSQKPEALLDRLIRASSNAGDTILDPFSGTFTTCAVAQRLGRQSLGIEREEEYLKIGLRRLGVASHFNGQELRAPEKRYSRNARPLSNSGEKDLTPEQAELFDGTV